ncbi:acetyl-CoA C-acyltransferase [Olivibacter sp. CPCC 100613]|uniref:acetyl-CoA C-acyltransferase n=1 Tax=Olivibacter sp. CPCC 100613 TaxID=3079931 RepID=UPI002FF60603
MINEVYIVSAVRTPIGSFGGSLSDFTATQLGGFAVKEAVSRATLTAEDIQAAYIGNVLSANLGQAPATQVVRHAGLGNIPATTINKVCASGAKAIMLAAQSIALNHYEVIVAGGTESMSNVPYYLDKVRTGYRLGHQQLIDGLIRDGLWDVYNDYHMGSAAELCASACKVTREEQDQYAINSYRRAQRAQENGKFKEEIVPLTLSDKRGNTQTIELDEEINNVIFDKIPSLKPVFQRDGTVTAANASTLNDGAAALILMSKTRAQQLGVKPLARILGYADAQQEPEWFTTAPAQAIPLALQQAGLSAKEVDYYEINEAFSVVSIANNRLLQLDPEKVNIYGGAVSLGHPLGASGARIVVTLLSVLQQENGKYGVAGICNGGGGASALVIERL